MKYGFLCIMLVLSLILTSCSVFQNDTTHSQEESVLSSTEVSSSEEITSSQESEESSEEESFEESEEIILPDDPSELYRYSMSVLENSVSYTSKTESEYDLFQSTEPEPVLSYTAYAEVRLQEVDEHDKRLDFTTSLAIDGITSESRLFYIDGVGYYDAGSQKIKQAMSFEKALQFLGSDGDTLSLSPDMFGKITSEDLRSGKRIELTEIIDAESASSLVPETMSNGTIEDLRVTLYVNEDGTPAAEIVGMKIKIDSDHKNIEIRCEVIQTTTFSGIGNTVIKRDIDPKDYTDGIIYKN